ncbi:MAG: hypothetical protein HC908_12825 [Calothrix sp. SM1_7_51]|nr:hypothetical protein [Calothrix sp. SM1_7_51]
MGSWGKGQWQTLAQAQRVAVKPFIGNSQKSETSNSSPDNLNLDDVNFNGRLILSGTTGPFKIAKIQTQGASVGIGGGTVAFSDINFADNFADNNDPVNRGQNRGQKISAQLVANGVRLSRVFKAPLPSVLQNPLAGTFQIAGDTNNFSLNTLVGTGEGRLSVGNGTVTAKSIQLAMVLIQQNW